MTKRDGEAIAYAARRLRAVADEVRPGPSEHGVDVYQSRNGVEVLLETGPNAIELTIFHGFGNIFDVHGEDWKAGFRYFDQVVIRDARLVQWSKNADFELEVGIIPHSVSVPAAWQGRVEVNLSNGEKVPLTALYRERSDGRLFAPDSDALQGSTICLPDFFSANELLRLVELACAPASYYVMDHPDFRYAPRPEVRQHSEMESLCGFDAAVRSAPLVFVRPPNTEGVEPMFDIGGR